MRPYQEAFAPQWVSRLFPYCQKRASMGGCSADDERCERDAVDRIETPCGRHGFHPIRPDLGGEVQSADDLAQEGGFLVLGFGEGDGDLGAEEGYGEAWEAGSGAEVEQRRGVGVKVAGGEEAFAEVAADDLFGVADGGEVGTGVPLEEEVEVSGELGEEA